MANMLGIAVLFLILTGIASMVLGMTGPVPFTNILPGFGLALIFAAGATLALKYAGFKWVSGLKVSKQTAGIAGAILLVVSIYSAGWLGGIMGGIGTASLTPGASVAAGAVTGVTADQCKAAVTAANPTILGKAASFTATTYDFAANSPYGSTLGMQYYVFKDGVYLGTLTSRTAFTTGLKVGDTIDLIAITNKTYVGVDTKGICIDGEAATADMKAYTVALETNMKVTCYDSDGNTLDAAQNTSIADYNLTMGASETAKVTCKLKENTNNKVFALRGVATKSLNLTKDVKVTSAGWSSATLPTNFSTTPVGYSLTVGLNDTGYGRLYKLATATLMMPWQEVSVDFEVSTQSTDPSVVTNPSSAQGKPNLAIIQFVDEGTERDGTTGTPFNDVCGHDSNELNLGIEEPMWSPQGKTTGAVIQLL
jgi:hypothetical protein